MPWEGGYQSVQGLQSYGGEPRKKHGTEWMHGGKGRGLTGCLGNSSSLLTLPTLLIVEKERKKKRKGLYDI